MSGVESHLLERSEINYGPHTVTMKQVSLADLLRIVKAASRVKQEIGMTQADFEAMKLDKSGIWLFLEKAYKVIEDSITIETVNEDGFEVDKVKLNGAGLTIAREIGMIFRLRPLEVLDGTLDELYALIAAFWGVNANGPLGAKIRHITDGLTPLIKDMKELTILSLRRDLIAENLPGGTDIGGTINMSSPSSGNSVEPSESATFTQSPSDKDSNSSEAWATLSDTNPPASPGSEKESEAGPAAPADLPPGWIPTP